MSKIMVGEELVRVRYKFKGDKDLITVSVTEEQYVNLLELPIIEKCEIIGAAFRQVTLKEKDEFNKKIRMACESDQSHTKYLLK